MPSNELETIAASIQDALHRAYALGRSDALRRVVEMVQEDELGSRTIPLLSHSEPSAVEAPHRDQPTEAQPVEAQPIPLPPADAEAEAEATASGDAPRNDNAEHGGATRQEERASAPPASMKDFLLDYLYPLGGKK